MKYVLVILSCLPFWPAFSQYERDFRPYEFQDTIPPEIYQTLKTRLLRDKALVTDKGKVGSYIRSLYDQRFEYLVQTFNKDYFLLDHPLTHLLERINTKIHEHNPQLKGDVRVYTYGSAVPNAVSFGEGTICIMLGLLERLETEDEIAYVLCHELAHYYAGHAQKNIAELAALNYDKELKSKIDAIRNNPYGQYTKLKALFNSLDLSVTRHSRGSEFEADSLGLVYFLKTGYNPYAPLQVMKVLEGADSELHRDSIQFRKYFDFKNFPFKAAWAKYKKPDILYQPFLDGNSDTLRTHPNCLRRLIRLQQQIGMDTVGTPRSNTGIFLRGENRLASLEIINAHYHFREYGKALFKSMIMADQLPDNPYTHAMISKSLYQIYKAQKNHNLHAVLELPDPRFDENYDRLLTFVNRLRLHELANLAYEYVTTRPAEFYKNEDFIHALWMCSRFEFSKVDPEKVREEYEQLFPGGKYLSEITYDNR